MRHGAKIADDIEMIEIRLGQIRAHLQAKSWNRDTFVMVRDAFRVIQTTAMCAADDADDAVKLFKEKK